MALREAGKRKSERERWVDRRDGAAGASRRTRHREGELQLGTELTSGLCGTLKEDMTEKSPQGLQQREVERRLREQVGCSRWND